MDEEISKENVGDLLGHVKRNVVDMGTGDLNVETDLDSNELHIGTSLFAEVFLGEKKLIINYY